MADAEEAAPEAETEAPPAEAEAASAVEIKHMQPVPIDTTGDGKADAVGMDTTGDGQIDSIDLDGDGSIDIVKPVVVRSTFLDWTPSAFHTQVCLSFISRY